MTREEFAYRFLDDQEYGYFTPGPGRPKVTAALLRLAQCIPGDVDLPPIVIFAPQDDCYHASTVRYFGNDWEKDAAMIYFGFELESFDQEEADYVVAHEFAHTALRHHQDMTGGLAHEKAADALAASWGYKIPARRQEIYDEFKD